MSSTPSKDPDVLQTEGLDAEDRIFERAMKQPYPAGIGQPEPGKPFDWKKLIDPGKKGSR